MIEQRNKKMEKSVTTEKAATSATSPTAENSWNNLLEKSELWVNQSQQKNQQQQQKKTNRIKTETIEWRNQRYKKAVTMEKAATRPKEEQIYGGKIKQGKREIIEEKNQS